jgi:hypothetical protein
MKPLLSMRPLTAEERWHLEADRRPADAFRGRRAQIVLARGRRRSPKPLAQLVGGAGQTVRTVIRAFNTPGMEGWVRHSHRPKTSAPGLDAATCARLQHLWHHAPRLYGQPTGVWTLAVAAAGCEAQGLTARGLSDASLRRALKRLQTNGKRAKHGLTRPAPHSLRKTSGVSA